MSHGTVDQRAEVRAPQRGAPVARGRCSCCRRGSVTRRRMWDIAASCVSLHRRSAGFEKARSNSGRVDPDNVQTSGRHNRASASLFGDNRNHIERNRNARNKSLSLFCKQEWLSAGNRSLLTSILTTSSTVCSFTNCNKRMRSSFPIMFASREVKWSHRLMRTRLGLTYARVF